MKYISKYSNGKKVSDAQYITEIICEHKAKIEKEDLHFRFWTTKKWEKFFKNQIASANKLLKKHKAKHIILALNSDKGKKIYSLRAPHLEDIILQEGSKEEKLNQNLTKDYSRDNCSSYRSNKPVNNMLSKLKEIE